MELWVVFIIGALILIIAGLVIYILSLRSALKEIARELDNKLQTDTNTLISISSGDKAMRELAANINNQLIELRKERLKLKHGDAELKNAVANISHDLRTPLTAICGYLDLLANEPLPDKSERYTAVIRERAYVMRELTEELFRYSVTAGAADDLNFKSVCLNSVLEQSLAGAYGMLSERGIIPEIIMPERSIVRYLDDRALRRIFDNIIANAAKYSDGDLSVRLLSDGTVRFENKARELDAVQTAHLFDRFFTVNTARGSTGLGLSIAKLLTEKMKGRINAEFLDEKLSIEILFPE